jgi:hypothetical protein
MLQAMRERLLEVREVIAPGIPAREQRLYLEI